MQWKQILIIWLKNIIMSGALLLMKSYLINVMKRVMIFLTNLTFGGYYSEAVKKEWLDKVSSSSEICSKSCAKRAAEK